MSTEGNKVGRPLKFGSVDELNMAIAQWLDVRKSAELPLTLSSLAVHLECDRKTLLNYSNKEEFFPTIKHVRQMCEASTEDALFIGKNAAGPIFSLKNNYGWVDKTEADLNHSGGIAVETVSFAGAAKAWEPVTEPLTEGENPPIDDVDED